MSTSSQGKENKTFADGRKILSNTKYKDLNITCIKHIYTHSLRVSIFSSVAQWPPYYQCYYKSLSMNNVK